MSQVVFFCTAIMPLNTVPNPLELSSYEGVIENFVIFYASRDESGRMWCPDCRDVEDIIKRTFASADDGPSGLIVYVGQKSEWKTEGSKFRLEPWRIQSIPTIVKLKDGVEVERLVEGDITASTLAALVE
jgi:hypothetical protein